jgi:DnaK suppressor protein
MRTSRGKTKVSARASAGKKKVSSKKVSEKASQRKSAARTAATRKAPKREAAAKRPAATAVARRPAPTGQHRSAITAGYSDFAPYQPRRGEEYMNPEQSRHFRNILLGWRRQLMEEVDRTVHHMQDDASNFPDPNDRATQEEEFALELRTRDRERKLIKKINESLGALDAGDYGYCELCGVEIGIERLEARPTATLCIDCKTLDEIREKQHI